MIPITFLIPEYCIYKQKTFEYLERIVDESFYTL